MSMMGARYQGPVASWSVVALAALLAWAGCGGGSPPAGSCASEAPSSWTYHAAIPSTDCAARAPTRCTPTDVAGGTPLTSLATLADGPCGGPGFLSLRIEVDGGGCPTLLEASAQQALFSATESDYLACFAALLATLRFQCTTRTTCSTLNSRPLPANPP